MDITKALPEALVCMPLTNPFKDVNGPNVNQGLSLLPHLTKSKELYEEKYLSMITPAFLKEPIYKGIRAAGAATELNKSILELYMAKGRKTSINCYGDERHTVRFVQDQQIRPTAPFRTIKVEKGTADEPLKILPFFSIITQEFTSRPRVPVGITSICHCSACLFSGRRDTVATSFPNWWQV
ncbi:hypothetical protein Tco_1467753 [Tanacetum coccineum]